MTRRSPPAAGCAPTTRPSRRRAGPGPRDRPSARRWPSSCPGRRGALRVVGTVRALDEDGRVAYVRPRQILDADRSLAREIVVRVSPPPTRRDRRGLRDLGDPRRRSAARRRATENFLGPRDAAARGRRGRRARVPLRARPGARADRRASGADALAAPRHRRGPGDRGRGPRRGGPRGRRTRRDAAVVLEHWCSPRSSGSSPPATPTRRRASWGRRPRRRLPRPPRARRGRVGRAAPSCEPPVAGLREE